MREHGPTVLRVCRAVLGPGADADDAWSETFLSALRAWPDLPEGTDVRAWLVTVAHRRAVDVVRAQARSATPVSELPPEGVHAHAPLDAAHLAPAADSALAGGELWAAVAALPERQRLAVAYHWLGGLTHVQTAALVGGSAASVRRAAADGLASLRTTLAHFDPKADES